MTTIKRVLVDGTEVFKGTYNECEKWCKRNGYMVYNGVCWDFRYGDVAIV